MGMKIHLRVRWRGAILITLFFRFNCNLIKIIFSVFVDLKYEVEKIIVTFAYKNVNQQRKILIIFK